MIAGGHVLVPNSDFHVVSKIFDVDVECLVPFRSFSCAIKRVGLNLLLTRLDDNVRVHFAEEICISRQPRFNDFEPESA